MPSTAAWKAMALLCLFALIVPMNPGAWADGHGAITFTFAPPDGLSYGIVTRIQRQRHVPGQAMVRDESVARVNIDVTRVDAGYELRAVPAGMTSRRNGELVNNPVLDLVAGIELRYLLDPSGKLLALEGHQQFVDALRRRVSAEVFDALEPVLNVQAMRQREIAEWNARIGDFIGVNVNPGDAFEAEVPFTLPNGAEMVYRIHTVIDGIEPCGQTECLRIEQVYDSESGGLGDMTAEIMGRMMNVQTDDATTPGEEGADPRISGSVSRLIDPLTMLIHGEIAERRIDLRISLPDTGPVMTTTTERREYQYHYPNTL